MAKAPIASEPRVRLRWAAFVTGYTPNDDYRPTVSEGESQALSDEITQISLAFHPHNEVRLFPSGVGRDVYLFWNAKSGGGRDYVFTRVTDASSGGDAPGGRRSLESYSLILSVDDLAQLGNNPFRAESLRLFDRVSEQFKRGVLAPIETRILLREASHALHSSQIATNLMSSGGDSQRAGAAHRPEASAIYSDEKSRAIQEWVARQARTGGIPPSFALWWESSKPLPERYFDIVLRAPAQQKVTVASASDVAEQLIGDIRGSFALIRSGGGETQRLNKRLDDFEEQITKARYSSDQIESVEDFRTLMNEATGAIRLIGNELDGYSRSDRLDVADRSRLKQLADRAKLLSEDLARVRPPMGGMRQAAQGAGVHANGAGGRLAAAGADATGGNARRHRGFGARGGVAPPNAMSPREDPEAIAGSKKRPPAATIGAGVAAVAVIGGFVLFAHKQPPLDAKGIPLASPSEGHAASNGSAETDPAGTAVVKPRRHPVHVPPVHKTPAPEENPTGNSSDGDDHKTEKPSNAVHTRLHERSTPDPRDPARAPRPSVPPVIHEEGIYGDTTGANGGHGSEKVPESKPVGGAFGGATNDTIKPDFKKTKDAKKPDLKPTTGGFGSHFQ